MGLLKIWRYEITLSAVSPPVYVALTVIETTHRRISNMTTLHTCIRSEEYLLKTSTINIDYFKQYYFWTLIGNQ